jgi:hypothetical protein
MRPLFYGEFADFAILYLHSTDNMYLEYKVEVPMNNM